MTGMIGIIALLDCNFTISNAGRKIKVKDKGYFYTALNLST